MSNGDFHWLVRSNLRTEGCTVEWHSPNTPNPMQVVVCRSIYGDKRHIARVNPETAEVVSIERDWGQAY